MRELGLLPVAGLGLIGLAIARPLAAKKALPGAVVFFVVLVGAAAAPAFLFQVGVRWGPVTLVAALHLSLLMWILIGSRSLSALLDRKLPPTWPRPIRVLFRVAIADVLVFALALPGLMLALAVHHAPFTIPVEPGPMGLTGERVGFDGANGTRLAGVWIENPRGKGAVMLVHGLGAEKMQFLAATAELVDRGYSVFTYDQRAHGDSGA